MLTLPEFTLLRPRTLAEAAALLAEHRGDARLLAGGTDLLVNMKHGLLAPAHLIDLSAVEGAAGVRREDDGSVAIGALTTLAELESDPIVAALYPSLSEAAGLVAGPQLRNMGTLGGNVCLDTRCVYINQTHFWRQSLGYCLKKDGTVCHVVANGRRCVAAQSSDTAPVLVSLDARARLLSVRGERTVPVESLYRRDGADHLALEADEVLTEIVLAPTRDDLRTAYRKLRVRQAIDYPALSIAVAARFDLEARLNHLAVVGTALMATPRRLGGLDELLGRPLDDEVIDAVATRAHKQLVPMTNILVDPEWRREMVPVFVRRALRSLVASREPAPHAP
jgi:4-hydroxybenzoyl-CoA reductase subunit beta